MRNEIVVISLKQYTFQDYDGPDAVFTGRTVKSYCVLVGTKWRYPKQDQVFSGSRTEIPVRFETLPRARSVARFLRDTYKAEGRQVICNLRPERG